MCTVNFVVFKKNHSGPIGYPSGPKKKKRDLNFPLTPYRKTDSKWIADLNVKGKTVKLSRRKHSHLQDRKYFSNCIKTALTTKENVDNCSK